ncbi:MAG TPA: hypothetical protein VGE91_09920 [Solirubrobacterales bacterium]|jgi:hypothetical protein
MRTGAILATLLALALAGCGGGSGRDDTQAGTTTPTTDTATRGVVTGKLPPGAVGPVDTQEEEEEGPAATEASPEAQAVGPESSGELSGGDRATAVAAVGDYIRALDRHDAARVCGLLLPGALRLDQLPQRRSGCEPSLRASIGTRPRGGAPAWRKTTLVEVKPEDLGDGRARVSATVTHHFSDRKYVSVEDDVIYLQRVGGRWRLAKPSGTLYRAVGYDEPPLDAFKPPPGWG